MRCTYVPLNFKGLIILSFYTIQSEEKNASLNKSFYICTYKPNSFFYNSRSHSKAITLLSNPLQQVPDISYGGQSVAFELISFEKPRQWYNTNGAQSNFFPLLSCWAECVLVPLAGHYSTTTWEG